MTTSAVIFIIFDCFPQHEHKFVQRNIGRRRPWSFTYIFLCVVDPGFPRVGGANPKGEGANLLLYQIFQGYFCIKMRKFAPGERHVPGAPLGPHTVSSVSSPVRCFTTESYAAEEQHTLQLMSVIQKAFLVGTLIYRIALVDTLRGNSNTEWNYINNYLPSTTVELF